MRKDLSPKLLGFFSWMAFFLAAATPHVTHAQASTAANILLGVASSAIAGILGTVGSIILSIAGFFLFVVSQVFDYTLQFSIGGFAEIVADGGTIMQVWTITRDLSNILFIFALLYIAISTVLQSKGVNTKEMVLGVITAAILVNFSAFFAKVIIDPSNILAGEFYHAIQQGYSTKPQGYVASAATSLGVSNGTSFPGIAGIIVDSIDLPAIFKLNDPEFKDYVNTAATGGSQTGALQGDRIISVLVRIVGGIGLILVTSFVLLAATVYFLIRLISLTFLIALAPLAFVSKIVPATKKFSDEWWSMLTNQAFFAPAYTGMMYISLRVLTDAEGLRGALKKTTGEANILGFTTGDASELIFFCIVMGFMMGSLYAASKMGAMGSKQALAFASKWNGRVASGITSATSGIFGQEKSLASLAYGITGRTLKKDISGLQTTVAGGVAKIPLVGGGIVQATRALKSDFLPDLTPSSVVTTAGRFAADFGENAGIGKFSFVPTKEDQDKVFEKSRQDMKKEVNKAKSPDDLALTFDLLSEDEQIEVLKTMSAREQALFFDKMKTSKKYRDLEGELSAKQSADNEEKYQEAKKKREEEVIGDEARKMVATGAPDPITFAKLGTPRDKDDPEGQYKKLEKGFSGFEEKEIEAELAKRDEFQKKVYEKLSPANRAKLSDKIEEDILQQTANLNKITDAAQKKEAQGRIDELKTLLERVSEMKASLGLDDRKATTNAEERLVKDRVVGEQIKSLETTAQAGNLELLKVRSILEQIARVDNSYVKSIRSEVRYNPVVIEAMNPKMAASAYQGARAEQQKIMASVAAQNPESGIAAYLNGNPLKQAKNRSEPKQQEQSQPEESGPVADTRKTYL